MVYCSSPWQAAALVEAGVVVAVVDLEDLEEEALVEAAQEEIGKFALVFHHQQQPCTSIQTKFLV